jgi:hypothetical protein
MYYPFRLAEGTQCFRHMDNEVAQENGEDHVAILLAVIKRLHAAGFLVVVHLEIVDPMSTEPEDIAKIVGLQKLASSRRTGINSLTAAATLSMRASSSTAMAAIRAAADNNG